MGLAKTTFISYSLLNSGHFKEDKYTGKGTEKYYATKLRVLLDMLYIDQWKRFF
jgi:hypothetical protein